MSYQRSTAQKMLPGAPPLFRDEIPVSEYSLRKLPEHKHVFSEIITLERLNLVQNLVLISALNCQL